MLPAEFALVDWSLGDTGKITTLRTSDRRSFSQPPMQGSAGACDSEWMKGDPAQSPDGQLFLLLLKPGFHDDAAVIEALREFAKIEGCHLATFGLAYLEEE